jgi:hypothetical protein
VAHVGVHSGRRFDVAADKDDAAVDARRSEFHAHVFAAPIAEPFEAYRPGNRALLA